MVWGSSSSYAHGKFVGRCRSRRWAFAVIAEPGGLEDGGAGRARRRLPCSSAREWTGRQGAVGTSMLFEEALFGGCGPGWCAGMAVPGRTGRSPASRSSPSGADVLELEGDHVGLAREGTQARRGPSYSPSVWPAATRAAGQSGSGLRIMAAIAQPGRRRGADIRPSWPPPTMPMVAFGRQRRHADGSAGFLGDGPGFVRCDRRRAARRGAASVVGEHGGGEQGRPLIAPGRGRWRAWPTGMPAGICTMESNESMPLRAWLFDRHAEHGQGG